MRRYDVLVLFHGKIMNQGKIKKPKKDYVPQEAYETTGEYVPLEGYESRKEHKPTKVYVPWDDY